MSFSFILEGLNGVARSELPLATGRQFTVGLRGMATAQFTVPLTHPDADFLLEGDALLKIVETVNGVQTTHAHVRLLTANEVASSGVKTLATAWVDPYWVLTKRLAGKSLTGYTNGSAVSQVDRGTIIADLVNTTNADRPSGVRMGTVTPSSNTYIPAGQWLYKSVGQGIAELSATLDGPEWRVFPIDYVAASGSPVGYYGELRVAPTLGTYKPAAAFEYGDGLLNVDGYQRGVSLDASANRMFSLPPGFPNHDASAVGDVIQKDDAPSQAARELLEDIYTQGGSDLSVVALRTKLLELAINIRKGPRQVITFTPQPQSGSRVPRFGTDYTVGDIVPFRASVADEDDNLIKRIDVVAKVYQVAMAIDDFGTGTATLTTTADQ